MTLQSKRKGVCLYRIDLEHQSPTFLSPRTGSMEGNFSVNLVVKVVWGWFKCIIFIILYFCYWYIVIYNETIIQLTTIQDQWGLWTCFPATRQSHLWVMGDRTVTPEVCCLCPVYSIILLWLPSLQKALLYKDRMLEIEASFSVSSWQPQENKSCCQIKHDFAHFQSKVYLLTLSFVKESTAFIARHPTWGQVWRMSSLCSKGLSFRGRFLKRVWGSVTGYVINSCIVLWLVDGEVTMETVTDFIFGGSKITADVYCSHEIKRHLLLGIKIMDNLDSILKSRDITLPTKVHLVKAMVFAVVMYGSEKAMAPHSSTLAWKIPWIEGLVGCSPWGR